MSATDQMRDMIAQLMGSAPDGTVDGRRRIRFDDPQVCRSFLLGCCPYDVLAGTRMDVGQCQYLHELYLVADYEKVQAERDLHYDIDALRHLERFIAECDNRVDQAKRKLKETQEELNEEQNLMSEKLNALGEQIGTKLATAEQLGADGRVEESLALMAEVETLKKVKNEAEEDYRKSLPASTYQQQKLRVCEVCSAYLGIHDNDRRLADHFGGKLHMGFITLRKKLEELKQQVQNRGVDLKVLRPPGEARNGASSRRRSRSRSRSRSSPKRHKRSRSRDRDNRHGSDSKERYYRHKHRSRSRERERDRNRSGRR